MPGKRGLYTVYLHSILNPKHLYLVIVEPEIDEAVVVLHHLARVGVDKLLLGVGIMDALLSLAHGAEQDVFSACHQHVSGKTVYVYAALNGNFLQNAETRTSLWQNERRSRSGGKPTFAPSIFYIKSLCYHFL